jgi:hypothetical protein
MADDVFIARRLQHLLITLFRAAVVVLTIGKTLCLHVIAAITQRQISR